MEIKVRDNLGNKYDLVEFAYDHNGSMMRLIIRDSKGDEKSLKDFGNYTIFIVNKDK